MTRFVLIPGAWLGAWAWKDVAERLATQGHTALPVTLTGLAERSHLASRAAGMETAVADVLGLIRYHELDDFVLVGHSFAGKVAAAVADRTADRVRNVIYLDAFRPERVRTPQGGFDPTGEFGAVPPGGVGIPLTPEIIERIGSDLAGPALARMRSLATPWPIRLAQDPITLSEAYDGVAEAYVFCSRSGDPVDEIVAGKWGALHGPHRVLDAGHWPMLSLPGELATALTALARD